MKVSVLTPSFNSSKYIKRAIESVLAQEYYSFEHVIMDGGSTDGTIEILKQYPHLIWRSEKDQGQSDAMNKAFNLATGDIIVYLNADDWFREGVFNLVASVFDTSKSSIVIGNITMVHEDGSTPVLFEPPVEYKKCVLHYIYGFPNNPISYFYKRHVQETVGKFNISNHYAMDYEFILRALQLYGAHKVNENFGFYWFDGKNKTSTRDNIKDCRSVAIRHLLKYDWKMLLSYLNNYYLLPIRTSVNFWLRSKLIKQ